MNTPIIQGVKLTFGDEALIKLQKKYQIECEEKEKLEKDRKEGKLRKFKVHLSLRGSIDVEVEATDKAQAEDIAIEEADTYDSRDIEYDVDWVDEIKNQG